MLLAAAVVAIALLPVVIAYMQLGYGGVATTEPTATTPEAGAVEALERAAFDVATVEQGQFPWENRSSVATRVVSGFDARAEVIESADVEGGRVHEIERDQNAAQAWADDHCPGGPDRQFGPCTVDRGVVLQERAGDAHVLAIAVEVRTVTDGGEYRGTYVLDAAHGNGPVP